MSRRSALRRRRIRRIRGVLQFDETTKRGMGYKTRMGGSILAVLGAVLLLLAEALKADGRSRALALAGAAALLVGSTWTALSDGQWWAPIAGLLIAGCWIAIDRRRGRMTGVERPD